MKVSAIKTPTLYAGDNLLGIIKTSVDSIPEKSVLVVTSKVVALWENAVVDALRRKENKSALVKAECERYTDPTSSQYELALSIRDGVIGVNAGIDESNVAEGYVLLPKDSYKSAKKIWNFIREEYGVKDVGVIITDSVSMPLKWGVLGRSIGHCGFEAVKSRIGEKDLFGREMQMCTVAVAEALASAAVFAMGEVDESTPLALVTDIPHISFKQEPPTDEEIASIFIEPEDDVFAPILMKAPWKQGERQARDAKKETH